MYAIRSYYGIAGNYTYETECMGVELDGSQTLKAYGYGKDRSDERKELTPSATIRNASISKPESVSSSMHNFGSNTARITSYNVCYTKLLRYRW